MTGLSAHVLSPVRLAEGFSLLELALVVCLIGILIAVALTRLLP